MATAHHRKTALAAATSAFVVLALARPALCQPRSVSERSQVDPAQPAPAQSVKATSGLQELGITVGGIDYTESNVHFFLATGGTTPGQPFVTRGDWLAGKGEYSIWRWLAVAAIGRVGWLDRSPPTTPAEPLVPGQNTSGLDPQLGDPHVGGSIAAMLRFLPGRTALDAGLTISFGSFRPRYGGASLRYGEGGDCGDCETGQDTFTAMNVWPTLRVSRTGTGFFFAVGTGEGFVQTNEPGPFELLFGERQQSFDLMGGVARGLALRVDLRAVAGLWLDISASYKPWGSSLPGRDTERAIFALGLTRRWSDFAPL